MEIRNRYVYPLGPELESAGDQQEPITKVTGRVASSSQSHMITDKHSHLPCDNLESPTTGAAPIH